jgi:hypothetical protein
MKCRQHRWWATVAIVSLAGTRSSLAESVNPFSPSTADIQALSDNTAGFSNSNQLSTIDAIHIAPDGIHLDVTWRVGTGSDPFGTHPGENFSRVVLSGYQNNENEGLGRLLNPPYDGIKWCIMSDQPISAQPYLQTAPDWTYYQPASDPQIPGDMSLTMATLSFDSTTQNNGSVAPDVNGEIRSNSFGLQFFTSFAMTPGDPVQGHIWISNWVPEPSTAALMLLGMVGLIGRKRR